MRLMSGFLTIAALLVTATNVFAGEQEDVIAALKKANAIIIYRDHKDDGPVVEVRFVGDTIASLLPRLTVFPELKGVYILFPKI
jgi:hypothetical protein